VKIIRLTATRCFWFLPDKLVHLFDSEFEFDDCKAVFGPKKSSYDFIGGVTSAVRGEMVKRGQLLMGYSSLALNCEKSSFAFPYFFRFVAVGRQLSLEHLVFALKHLQEIGNDVVK
jgi:hypothetical protein